ncbi:MAG: GTPase [Lachnospiraceae bacterium]|jgi:G3E family GTPase|nr:GTPase [Lachnospiraceae bacterium]
MEEDDVRVPVYLVNGFLEGGKTSFLRFTVAQEYFDIDEPTLLILCEEGEEEYDLRELADHDTRLEIVEDQEHFNEGFLQKLEEIYQPGRVLIEYNGMWQTGRLHQMELPEGWEIVQQITTIDASTCQVYMNNMKSLFMDMVRDSELVIFNRCTPELPLASFRRNIKAVNQRSEIIFEDETGELDNIFEEEMPFNLDAPVVDIPLEDYGIWYLDALEHTDRYLGKTLRFRAQVMKDRRIGHGIFVPGRMAMACCEEDTSFIGFICKSDQAETLRNGQWITLTAKLAEEYARAYRAKGPVLYAESIEEADPLPDDMVFFN